MKKNLIYCSVRDASTQFITQNKVAVRLNPSECPENVAREVALDLATLGSTSFMGCEIEFCFSSKMEHGTWKAYALPSAMLKDDVIYSTSLYHDFSKLWSPLLDKNGNTFTCIDAAILFARNNITTAIGLSGLTQAKRGNAQWDNF